MTRDHGGNLDAAQARFGPGDWIDLSTAINRRPWPMPPFSDAAFRALPMADAERRMVQVAADWFGCATDHVLPMAGATAAIRQVARLRPAGRAAVLTPSCNNHASSLTAAGWRVTRAPSLTAMEGADLAVVMNPNNPDGREWSAQTLATLARRVGLLIVDERFADARPDLSLAPALPANTLVLRTFGEFWGQTGLRVWFAVADPDLLTPLREAGTWSVNASEIKIATAAMADRTWADDTVTYHAEAALHLDHMALRAGLQPLGGTHLFRLYDTPDAQAAQDALARDHVWTRRFRCSDRWLRLGIPGNRDEFARVRDALQP